jgi:hypothetical protein
MGFPDVTGPEDPFQPNLSALRPSPNPRRRTQRDGRLSPRPRSGKARVPRIREHRIAWLETSLFLVHQSIIPPPVYL